MKTKKVLIIALLVTFLFGLIGCGKKETEKQDTVTTEETKTPGTETEVVEPETTEPEQVEPEQVETVEPETAEPEETEPETTEPEVTEPEETEPESSEPVITEPVTPEPVEPEKTEPEASEPEVEEPETTEPEITEPETTEPEESEEDMEEEEEEPEIFTVTFKDYDGTVLSVQEVEDGKAAEAPSNPSRKNYTFAGWNKSFDKVTKNLTVKATYEAAVTIIRAESVKVDKGTEEVSVDIRVLKNPGIMGAVLEVSVDDQVFAFDSAKSIEFPGLSLTSPGSAVTSSPYSFMLDALELSEEDRKDGILFTVTFKVKNTKATGNYTVALSYDNGAIFDENYGYPEIVLENGTIEMK